MRRFSHIAAIIVWLSLIARLALDITTSVQGGAGALFGVIKFITAFTHLTNAFIGLILTAAVVRSKSTIFQELRSASVATCAATYITVMAMVWKVMLAPSFANGLRILTESVSFDRIVGAFLHGMNPALFLCFWLFMAPKRRLQWKYAFVWPSGVLVYFVIILVRGAIGNNHPYPFVDVQALGYGHIMTNAAMLLAVFVSVGLAFIGIARWDPAKRIRGLES